MLCRTAGVRRSGRVYSGYRRWGVHAYDNNEPAVFSDIHAGRPLNSSFNQITCLLGLISLNHSLPSCAAFPPQTGRKVTKPISFPFGLLDLERVGVEAEGAQITKSASVVTWSVCRCRTEKGMEGNYWFLWGPGRGSGV